MLIYCKTAFQRNIIQTKYNEPRRKSMILNMKFQSAFTLKYSSEDAKKLLKDVDKRPLGQDISPWVLKWSEEELSYPLWNVFWDFITVPQYTKKTGGQMKNDKHDVINGNGMQISTTWIMWHLDAVHTFINAIHHSGYLHYWCFSHTVGIFINDISPTKWTPLLMMFLPHSGYF